MTAVCGTLQESLFEEHPGVRHGDKIDITDNRIPQKLVPALFQGTDIYCVTANILCDRQFTPAGEYPQAATALNPPSS